MEKSTTDNKSKKKKKKKSFLITSSRQYMSYHSDLASLKEPHQLTDVSVSGSLQPFSNRGWSESTREMITNPAW